MTRPDWSQPPAKPICWNADRSGPCEFAKVCSERRQRIAAAVIQTPHGEVVREDLASRGAVCPWFVWHQDHAAVASPDPPPAAA